MTIQRWRWMKSWKRMRNIRQLKVPHSMNPAFLDGKGRASQMLPTWRSLTIDTSRSLAHLELLVFMNQRNPLLTTWGSGRTTILERPKSSTQPPTWWRRSKLQVMVPRTTKTSISLGSSSMWSGLTTNSVTSCSKIWQGGFISWGLTANDSRSHSAGRLYGFALWSRRSKISSSEAWKSRLILSSATSQTFCTSLTISSRRWFLTRGSSRTMY